MCRIEMAGGSSWNDAAIAEALAAMTQVLAQANEQEVQGQQHQGGGEELRLERFMRNHPPMSKGRYDPQGAHTWLQGIERIFWLTFCRAVYKNI